MSTESSGQQLSVVCLRDAGGDSADMCRTPSCHSRVHVRDVRTEWGSVTLCRPCRKHYLQGRGSA